MARLSDEPLKAVSGPVMRRTDEHVLENSQMKVSRSGDSHVKGPQFNTNLRTCPDSDPRWGKDQNDPDWPEEA